MDSIQSVARRAFGLRSFQETRRQRAPEHDDRLLLLCQRNPLGRFFLLRRLPCQINSFIHASIRILDVFFCPHDPKSNCSCRKPRPGMLIEGRDKYNIDMKNSWMIGDKEVDVIAANAAGIDNTILVRSVHRIDESNSKASFFLDSIQQSKQIITA